MDGRDISIFGCGENAIGDHRFDHELCRECFGVSTEFLAVPVRETGAVAESPYLPFITPDWEDARAVGFAEIASIGGATRS